jgi:hypothetical protein
MTAKDWSTILATWLVVLGTLAGGYTALITFQRESAKTLDDRQKQTLALAQHFISSDFLPIREKMTKVVRAAEACGDWNRALSDMSETERFAFFEFFDIVDACLEASMCDPSLIERIFVPYANGEWPILKHYVSLVRASEVVLKVKVPFASGLERLAQSPLKEPDCQRASGQSVR